MSNEIEVGVIILNTPAEFRERMYEALNNAASKTLHALIDAVPENAQYLSGSSKNEMRKMCRYAERWQTSSVPWGTARNMAQRTPGFAKVLDTILTALPFHQIMSILAENNELRRDIMKIVASKFK